MHVCTSTRVDTAAEGNNINHWIQQQLHSISVSFLYKLVLSALGFDRDIGRFFWHTRDRHMAICATTRVGRRLLIWLFFSANQRNLIITPLFTSKMLSRRIATTSPTAHARAFHASATKASKEVIMNRYSRIITQPKAQGASQVRFLSEALRLTRLGHALRHRRHWEWRRLQQGHGWRCQCLVRRQPVSYFYWTRLTF